MLNDDLLNKTSLELYDLIKEQLKKKREMESKIKKYKAAQKEKIEEDSSYDTKEEIEKEVKKEKGDFFDKYFKYIKNLIYDLKDSSDLYDNIKSIIDNLNDYYKDKTILRLQIELYKDIHEIYNFISLENIEDDNYKNELKIEALVYEKKLNIIKSLKDKKEIEPVEKNLNNLIFIPTKSSNRTLVDIDKIPQESYPLFIELLDSIRSGILKNYKRFTSDNSNFEDLVLAEVRYNDARVLFERIDKNKYVIISMFIKKCRNNLGYKNTLYSAISAYKMVKDKLIELSSDSNFLQAQDETTNEIYNILNKNNKNEKKLKKV